MKILETKGSYSNSRSGFNGLVRNAGIGLLLSVAAAAQQEGTADLRSVFGRHAQAVSPRVADKLRDMVDVLNYGAKCDGTSDDTAAIQSAIDAVPSGGVLDGRNTNDVCVVTTLNFKSHMTAQHLHLKTKSGSTDGVSPVTVDGRFAAPKTHITFRDVHVDGNRAKQTAVGATLADGNRYCFQVKGYVSYLLIEDSEGSYCATDGLFLSEMNMQADDDPALLALQNITILNSDFSFNRRMGISYLVIHDFQVRNVKTNNNGLILAGQTDKTHGNFCANVLTLIFIGNPGGCFGSGFWYENDYAAGGGGFDSVTVDKLTSTGNFKWGMYFLTNTAQTAPNFRPRTNFRLTNSHIDRGTAQLDTLHDESIVFEILIKNIGLGAVYRNFIFENNHLEGVIRELAIDGMLWSGGTLETRLGYAITADYSDNLRIVGLNITGKGLNVATHKPDGTTGNNLVRVITIQ